MEGIACLLFNRIQEYDDVQCGGLILLKHIWSVNEKSDMLYYREECAAIMLTILYDVLEADILKYIRYRDTIS